MKLEQKQQIDKKAWLDTIIRDYMGETLGSKVELIGLSTEP
jgi:hypothetical protein